MSQTLNLNFAASPLGFLLLSIGAAGFRNCWGIVWNWFFMRKRTHDMSFWSQNCVCFCCVITVVEVRTSRVMTHLHFEFWCCMDSGSMSWSQLREHHYCTKAVWPQLMIPSSRVRVRANILFEPGFFSLLVYIHNFDGSRLNSEIGFS